MNDLYRRFGAQSAQIPAQATPQQTSAQVPPPTLQELQQNTAAVCQRAGVSVPQEMMGNPQSIVMYLLNSGQVRNPGAVRAMIQRFAGRV